MTGTPAVSAASLKPACCSRRRENLNLDLTRTPFIGDDERDEQAAEAAGCLFSWCPTRLHFWTLLEERLKHYEQ